MVEVAFAGLEVWFDQARGDLGQGYISREFQEMPLEPGLLIPGLSRGLFLGLG